jgi:uncharacterized membrane protein YozB (DUF420 family)
MADYATVVVVSASTDRRRQVDRRFYIGVALFMVAFNAVAFAPSILSPSTRNVPLPLTPLVTAHALVSGAWLLLFLAQATLVATGRTGVHRRLGVGGAVLTAVFLVLGWFTTLEQARRGFDLSGAISRVPAPPGLDLIAATVGLLFFFLTFGVLAGTALWYRRRPAVHKRLMLLALLGGLSPTPVAHVIGTWPPLQPWANLIFPGSLVVFLAIGPVHDRISDGRIHPVSLWGGLSLFVWNTAFNVAIIPSAAWSQFARWLI